MISTPISILTFTDLDFQGDSKSLNSWVPEIFPKIYLKNCYKLTSHVIKKLNTV